MTTDTLRKLALAAYDKEQQQLAEAELAHEQSLRTNGAQQLAHLTGLACEAMDIGGERAVFFRWQGFAWFVSEDQGEMTPQIAMYAWDPDEGWRWLPVSTLSEIGQRLFDLEVAGDDARNIKGADADFLPDGYRPEAQPVGGAQ